MTSYQQVDITPTLAGDDGLHWCNGHYSGEIRLDVTRRIAGTFAFDLRQ